VVAAILYLGYRVAKPCGLEVLVDLLAVVVVGGMLLVPARSLLRILDNPLERRHLRRGRIRIALGLLLCAGAGLLLVPLPHRVAAPVVLQPQGARRVYVTVSGTLVRSVAAGALVREDEELGRLVNLDLRREIAELTSQRNEQRRQLENLRARQSEDSQAAAQIPVAEAALADIEERLRGRQSDEQRLVLRAPMGGTVIPPPCQPDLFYRPGSLGAWQGTPLESRTLGAHLDVGTLFCLIGDPTRLDALLVIDQSDLQFVRECQHVRLQLDELPGRVLGGTIVELSKADLKVAPRELSRASELLVHFDREGNPRPLTPSYQARVVIQDAGQALLVGTRGRAKILVDPQPLAVRSFRSLRGLFHFRI
jgi:putative peptide zinc metalloprotease protein